MDQNLHYRMKTMEELARIYAEEATRVDKEDRERTRELVVKEAYARLGRLFRALDEEPGLAEKRYAQFLDGTL